MNNKKNGRTGKAVHFADYALAGEQVYAGNIDEILAGKIVAHAEQNATSVTNKKPVAEKPKQTHALRESSHTRFFRIAGVIALVTALLFIFSKVTAREKHR